METTSSTKKKGRWGSVFLALMLLFMYAPIAVLVVYSFNENKNMSSWGGFSLRWYAELFGDSQIMDALGVTLQIAVISALAATIIGTAAAIGINAMGKRSRGIVLGITNLPVVNPDLVTGVSLMLLYVSLFGFLKNIPGLADFLARFGVRLQLGYGTLLLAHITFNIPYVILAVMPRLRKSSDTLYEAAMDLGAHPFYALGRVIVPDIAPGMVTGAILAFTMSLDDFVVSFFTRQGVQNLSIIIYSLARRGISPKINALSTLMFVAVLALLVLVNVRSARMEKREGAL